MPRKKIKKVEPCGDIIRIQEGFANRFNIPRVKSGEFQFRNRCLTSISIFFTWISRNQVSNITTMVSKLLGVHLPFESNYGTSFESTKLYELLSKFPELSTDTVINNWLMIMEVVANTYTESDQEEIARGHFVQNIAEALELSGINAIICDTPDGFKFYPANAELLDIKLVVDVLNWLSDYPDAKEKYNNALRLFLKGDRTRHVLDDCRLSLELFMKQILNSPASLENQNKEKKGKSGETESQIGRYMKEKNVSKEVREMYSTLLKHYTTFNNENIKHDDAIIPGNEIEFFIYTTGMFIRFMISLVGDKKIKQGKLPKKK